MVTFGTHLFIIGPPGSVYLSYTGGVGGGNLDTNGGCGGGYSWAIKLGVVKADLSRLLISDIFQMQFISIHTGGYNTTNKLSHLKT